ncbi:hypothetical protein Q7C36_020520 [Tachysurus vachellii]|uniref:Uncharacterized protein n=1 Tax=Tachysurus vachellii TaxID=175792 RepID=A0AA88IXM0_TACVA|nr:hypothetical protein Q7C36_020520 [Tachysurus vachellii]
MMRGVFELDSHTTHDVVINVTYERCKGSPCACTVRAGERASKRNDTPRWNDVTPRFRHEERQMTQKAGLPDFISHFHSGGENSSARIFQLYVITARHLRGAGNHRGNLC